MLPLISIVLVVLCVLGLKCLLPVVRKRRRQVRFIRETLASDRKSDDRRIIASLSTVPERIGNLGPTVRSFLRQTRPPDEIVLAIRSFRFGSNGLMKCPNTFRACRACAFSTVAGIGDRRRSLSPSFEKN